MEWLGQLGFALPMGLGTIGSALGIGAAGRAAAGAWAKEAREGKRLCVDDRAAPREGL